MPLLGNPSKKGLEKVKKEVAKDQTHLELFLLRVDG